MKTATTTSSIPGSYSERLSLFTFRLSQQVFAFPVAPIQQIVEMVTITPLVKSEDLIEGVINVRGQTVLVVDLRRLFHLPVPPLGLHTPILLVESCGQMVGFIVDEVLDVIELPSGQMDDPAGFVPAGLDQLTVLKGIARTSTGPVALLDPNHLFDPGQEEVLRTLSTLSLNPEGPASMEMEPNG